MSQRTFPVHLTQLWADGSVMACKEVQFVADDDSDGITTAEAWIIPVSKAGVSGAVEFRRSARGPVIWTTQSSRPLNVLAGDALTYREGHLRFNLQGGPTAALFCRDPAEYVSLEPFMEKNPEATPGQIWEAAFVAGHQTAYTLLTGEPQ